VVLVYHTMWCDHLFPCSQFVLHTEPITCIAVPHTENGKRALTHNEGEIRTKCNMHREIPNTWMFRSDVISAGSDVVPRDDSSRTLHVTSCLLSVLLITSYSGALVSSFASRHVILPFTTFQEFLDDGTYRLGVVANSSIISNMRVGHIDSLTLCKFGWDKCNISKMPDCV